MNKLKILFITYTHSNGGGAEKVLTTLVNNLDREKYDISIFEIEHFDVKKEPMHKDIKLLPALYHYDDKHYRAEILVHILETMPYLIKSFFGLYDFDVILSWNYQKPSFMLPVFKDKKTIAWFHGAIDDLDYTHTSESDKYYRDLQHSAWDCADKIITISNRSLKSLEKVFPEYLNKAGIIHNAIDIENIRQKAESGVEFNAEKYGYPFLVCIGRLDKNKNVLLVIQSLAKLNRAGIQCGLLVIGIGEEDKNLKAEAEKLEISDKVFFLGYKQNPMPYLKQAKLLCVSSFSEGFPTVVCEAMALGKPFVTTPVAGASEELAYGGKCGLVAEWNTEDYTEKLKKLLTDAALYTQMAENCLERIKDFSIENTVLQFESLLASFPEKQTEETARLTKKEAFKKIKSVYVWNPCGKIQRIKFSVTRFKARKTLYHFMLLGYHILNLFRYTLCIPFRMCTAKKVLLRKEIL